MTMARRSARGVAAGRLRPPGVSRGACTPRRPRPMDGLAGPGPRRRARAGAPPTSSSIQLQEAWQGRRRGAFREMPRRGRPLAGPVLHRAALRPRGDRRPRRGAVGGVPDARVESSGQRLGDGRFIAAPVQLTGTHAGELPGVPATGSRRLGPRGPLLRARPAARAAVACARVPRRLRRGRRRSACCPSAVARRARDAHGPRVRAAARSWERRGRGRPAGGPH